MYGTSLNFEADRSELIVGFVAPGSKRARVALAGAQNSIDIAVAGECLALRVVQSYKHVGSAISVCKSIGYEISLRCGIIRSECLRLGRHVLSNRALPLQKKLHIIQAYILSKGCFRRGT